MSSQDRLDALTDRRIELITWLKEVDAGIHDIKISTLKEKLGIPDGEFYIKSKRHRKPIIYKITDVSMTISRYHADMVTFVGYNIDSETMLSRHVMNINKPVSEYALHFDICSKDGWVSKGESLKVNKQ